MDIQYSKQGFGGIGYRLDIVTDDGPPRLIGFTTNPDGSGLFFHDGRGGRDQIRGTG